MPGQRLVFDRNPRYFRKAPDGGALPYLDHLTVEILPDQNAELLRLEAGQIDMTETAIAPEAYAPLKRAADAGRVTLYDLGVGLVPNSLWFNLEAGRVRRRSARRLAAARRAAPGHLARGRSQALRRHGVPRRGRARSTARSRAANKKWYWPGCRRRRTIPQRRRQMLASIGLTDRNGDGMLEDARNTPARFTLLTQKGRPELERGAAVIRDELKKIGVIVDVVSLEASALIDRFANTKKYDAVYLTAEHDRYGPGDQSGLLVQLRQRAPVEHGAEDAGHRLGAAHRRADGQADRRARRRRAQAAVRRSAAACSPSTRRSSISPRRASTSPCRRA